MILSERLRALRAKYGITQKQCAEKLGVELTNYNKWENGISPSLETLCEIADYYCVTVDYLLGRDHCTTHEAQYINDVTGLSDKAISKLNYHTNKFAPSEYQKYFYIGLEALIEDYDLVRMAGEYFNGIYRRLQEMGVPILTEDEDTNRTIFAMAVYSRLENMKRYYIDSQGKPHDEEPVS